MIVENLRQGSTEWRQARCGVVTASNFRLVLAKGSGRTRRAYMQKLANEIACGQPESAEYYNDAMMRGTELEPRARHAYTKSSGNQVREVGLIFLDHDRRISASPDGLIGNDGGLEIKCPLPPTHEKYVKSSRAPAQYMPQIQGNLWISGRKWWDFVSYVPETECAGKSHLFVQRVCRDEDYIARLKREIESFLCELDKLLDDTRRLYA